MGRVQRFRAEYRRLRRIADRVSDAYAETCEELGDVLESRNAIEASELLPALDRLEEEMLAADARKCIALVRLNEAIEARAEKRQQAWADVRRALRQFGPAVLDVLRDVLLVASSDRPERLGAAVRGILEHTEIPLTEDQIGTVTELADRIVEALADDEE